MIGAGKLTPRPNDDAYRLYNEKIRTPHGGIMVTSLLVDTNARMIDVSNRSPSSALDQPLYLLSYSLIPRISYPTVESYEFLSALSLSLLFDFSKTTSADLERQSSIFIGLGQGPQEK